MTESAARTWKEIAAGFLKVGATGYGGPAIMGIMQAEFQERREWVSKPRFLEGLALAAAYATLGLSPILRGALYGLGPVVLGIFVVALFRLGRTALRALPHRLIAIGAAAAALTLMSFLAWSPAGSFASLGERPSVGALVALFSTIGAFTFGGGLSMIALLEEHVVNRLHWLSPQDFIAGLALGQLAPGPILMVAAYVGYKLLGVAGAAAAAAAVFLPSFVLMLAILPVFDRVRQLAWTRAVIQGIAPGVIGVMAVALGRMAPHAAPDNLAILVLGATVAGLLYWQLAPLPAVLAGGVVGVGAWGR
jgi:chromate transporter